MKIITNGKIVTPDGIVTGSIAFENGIITSIGDITPTEGDEVIDAKGCYIMPGFIDGHTHLQVVIGGGHTADDFESGTRAAACGGTTTLVDFATQDKGVSLTDTFNIWMERASGVSTCNFAFHMAIAEWNETYRKELYELKDKGVTSYKVYMAYDNLILEDREIYEILRTAKELGAICGCHCENWNMVKKMQEEQIEAGITGPEGHPLSRPAPVEAEAVNRFAYLAELADAPIYVVHLSTEMGLEEIRAAQQRGVEVYIETCPQYLLLDDSNYSKEDGEGSKFVMSPPLRKASDINALRAAIRNGEVTSIATDHCPFNYETQKKPAASDFRKIPNGAPGIEHRPALMFESFRDELSAEEICDLLSGGPARLLGMYPKKGALQAGSDADIVIWDPDKEWTITADDQQQKVDYTPYEGWKVRGKAAKVFVNGELVAEYGKPNGCKPGIYVSRSPSPVR